MLSLAMCIPDYYQLSNLRETAEPLYTSPASPKQALHVSMPLRGACTGNPNIQ